MLLKTQLFKLFKKVDTNLEHKSVSIQLASPRAIATFYVGYLLYTRFIDHQVRKQMTSQSKSLASYIDLFFKSQKHGFLIQNALPLFGVLSSGWAYFESKNIFWLIGGSLCFGMLGYDYFVVDPLRHKLLKQFEDTRILTERRQMQRTQNRFDLIRKLGKYLNGKIVLSVLAMVAFYFAELKHSDQVNVKLSLK